MQEAILRRHLLGTQGVAAILQLFEVERSAHGRLLEGHGGHGEVAAHGQQLLPQRPRLHIGHGRRAVGPAQALAGRQVEGLQQPQVAGPAGRERRLAGGQDPPAAAVRSTLLVLQGQELGRPMAHEMRQHARDPALGAETELRIQHHVLHRQAGP